ATTAVLFYADGEMEIIVSPHWDSERAAEGAPRARVIGANDLVEAALTQIRKNAPDNAVIGISGLRALPYDIASRLTAALPGAKSADKLVFDAARAKTALEIMNARAAARIAERGYQRLLEITRPGMSEDELAVELKSTMKSLGAEDNFLLLCAR